MALTPEQQLSEDKAQAVRFGVTEPVVSATALETPPEKVNPPVPKVSTNDGSRTAGLIDSVASNTQSFIQAQSEEAAKAKELAGLLGEQTFDGASQREQLGKEYGLPDNLSRLTDIQTQLAKANTASDITKSRIAGAAGQTMAQGQREITQEDRENAIRTAGLAAEAAVLQGSVQTASTLINQAMSDYYNDRQLQNANMIQQLNYFSGIADKQTAQLLQKEQRKYEEDQAKIERVQKAVDGALASGATTPNEVRMFTDPNTTDNERLALAQLIQARGSSEIRNIEMQSARTDLAIKAKQLARLREPVIATRETTVIDVGDEKQLIDKQTGEVIATFGADTSVNEIATARDINFVNTIDGLATHPGLNTSVGPTSFARTAGFDAFGNKDDFIASTENILKKLTMMTYEEAKASGATFGAMQQAEWDMLAESATKISQTRVYEKEGIPGFRNTTENIKGYDLAEKDFVKELDLLSAYAKLDAIRKGAPIEDVGVFQTPDGKYWSMNSDGSKTELPVTF